MLTEICGKMFKFMEKHFSDQDFITIHARFTIFYIIFFSSLSRIEKILVYRVDLARITIKGGSRRAEKSCKVLMMMKAAKLGWAGAGAGKKQGWTKSRARKGRSWAGQGQSRNWAGVG